MPPIRHDPFRSRATLTGATGSPVTYYSLRALESMVSIGLENLPFTVKILIENALRNQTHEAFTEAHVRMLCDWQPKNQQTNEFPFMPGRVVLQDLTGVPAVVDLAAMRASMATLGGDPKRINPLVPVDLVIDHSVQVDVFGSSDAYTRNMEREYERNRERFSLLRWAQRAFTNFRVVPPGTGIVHQVNLEYLANVVDTRMIDGESILLPDTVVGTDSHTTMISGLGVLGWGVGGIEAEAVMLGQPIYMLTPEVVGVNLIGQPREGITATDIVLTVTQVLRKHGVVNKFVEFAGTGLSQLSLPDRATLANMAPEYGATTGIFPVDDETLRYMRLTGRSEELIRVVETYCKAQGLFRTDDSPIPQFNELLELDLATVEPSMAGPKRPQDRVSLGDVRGSLRNAYPKKFETEATPVAVDINGMSSNMTNGSIVIAAITSCTNTSNPRVMVAAGLLAKKAIEHGLMVKPTVKTSLAPGSQVVTEYLDKAGLSPFLDALHFQTVGYGCTTCIGNSGPLSPAVEMAVKSNDLLGAAVLSGNRNFEGRVHPLAHASYLASPPLVVAYALAGTVDIDLTTDPLGRNATGEEVYLRDIWPTNREVDDAVAQSVTPDLFRKRYADVFHGDETWQSMPSPESDLFDWESISTYVQHPPYFEALKPVPDRPVDVVGARVLAMLGDSITTDHISPAGTIPLDRPAGRYLVEHDVTPRDFNTFGARRGNHDLMVRGTFGNIRLRNELVPDKEGDYTVDFTSGVVTSIFEASSTYQSQGIPLMIIAGKEYGTGSSRDWAAKGPALLGVKAVLAETFERIHRSNLVGMGVLPLEFKAGESRKTLGLVGTESFDVQGISAGLSPMQEVTVRVHRVDGTSFDFSAIARLDSPMDVAYYQHGGILQYVLRQLLKGQPVTA